MTPRKRVSRSENRGEGCCLPEDSEVAPRSLRIRLRANMLFEEVLRFVVERDVRGVESSSGRRRTGWARPSSVPGGAERRQE